MLDGSLASLVAEPDVSPHDQRRSHILDAARVCFARQGFHGASMQQICAEAKMSPGALYRYFPAKEAIIEAIADDERRRAAEAMAELACPGPLVDRLVTCAVRYLDDISRPGATALMVEIWSESLRNTAVGDRFACVEANVRDQLLELVESGKRSGEVGPDLPAGIIVDTLMSLADGMALRMAVDTAVSPEHFREPLRRMLVGLFS